MVAALLNTTGKTFVNVPIIKAESEVVIGWICFAIFVLELAAAVGIWIHEMRARGSESNKSNKTSLDYFIPLAVGYLVVRCCELVVLLTVTSLYPNMYASFILEQIGSALFLWAFAMLAMGWAMIIMQTKALVPQLKVLQKLIIVLAAVTTVLFTIFAVYNSVNLHRNFGLKAHDYHQVNDDGTITKIFTGERPQTSIIMGNQAVHDSLMGSLCSYGIAGFLIGSTIITLCIILLGKIHTSVGTRVNQAHQNKRRRTTLHILLVSIPVTLAFIVKFIFIIIEVATHRHGLRFEFYTTQYLATEIVAMGVLLVHFALSDRNKHKAEETRKSRMSTTLGTTTTSDDAPTKKILMDDPIQPETTKLVQQEPGQTEQVQVQESSSAGSDSELAEYL